MKHSASVLVRDQDGLILLLERNGSSQRFHGIWEFPGGKIDSGQTPQEAARREAKEEAGLVIPDLPAEPEKRIITASRELEYSFFCHDFTDARPVVTLSDEHSRFRWVTPIELRRMAAEGRIMAPHLEFFEWNWLKRQIELEPDAGKRAALTRIRLLLDDDSGAFEALCLAARRTGNPPPMSDIHRGLALIKDAIGSGFPGVAILERAAELFVREAKVRRQAGERSSWDSHGLETLVAYDPERHVLIIAGATGRIDAGRVARYEALLRAALDGCDAQILSGGTDAGVCGLLAKLARERAEAGTAGGTVHGYVPEHLPSGTQAAGEPVIPVKTPGATDFSIHEPLQMWTDLLSSGVDPAKVVLLCLGGGEISAAELALAWALGAKAAVIDDQSEAAVRFKKLLEQAGEDHVGGLLVPDDVPTLAAILCFRSSAPDSEWERHWEEPGKAVHAAYLQDQSRRAKEPNLLSWDLLPDGLKHSNRHQAFYAAEILRSHGFTVEESELPPEEIPVFEFGDSEKELIESMAEAEHGRWNAERLHDGWRHGEPKDAERKISPYLVPWAELPDEIKGYDRNAVRQWPKILARAGWVVRKAGASSSNKGNP